MPVKVRCQSCEKVFAAPDAARGKLVKCPGCEEKVRVPPGGTPKSGGPTKGAAKKPASKVQPEEHDHEHVLKNLDLDNIEDTETKVCPKCGQEIFEEDTIECPACGLNFETGLTKEKQRGIDPKLFYRVAFKDSWAFLTEYKSLALRTAMYSLVFELLHFGCLFMITWCVNLPPRVFWILLAFVTGMVAPGWLWFLDTEIIKATMEKKEKMPRVNFDMFTCVALGIKYNLWRVAIGLQLLLPFGTILLLRSQMAIPAIVTQVLTELLIFLMLPQALIHMTMPITTRGWLVHIHFKAWKKSFGACAYWLLISFVAGLPSLIPVGVCSAIGRQGLIEFSANMVYNYRVNSQLGRDLAAYADSLNRQSKNTPALEAVNPEDEKYKNRELPWKKMIVPVIGIVLSQLLFGFSAVFAMRANGLLGLYFKKHLLLQSMAKEIKWVSKTKKIDENDPAAMKAHKKQQLIQNSIAVVVFLAVIGGVAWYMLRKPSDGAAGAPSVQPGPVEGAVDPAAAGGAAAANAPAM
jgi:DNA-directed RNA polymerase subunit RPC12/RpoP